MSPIWKGNNSGYRSSTIVDDKISEERKLSFNFFCENDIKYVKIPYFNPKAIQNNRKINIDIMIFRPPNIFIVSISQIKPIKYIIIP